MLLQTWPSIVDDSGAKTDGTVLDKALFDAIKASVEDNIHSTNNPTVRTKTIIDEVVAARGNLASVDTRFTTAGIDANGVLTLPATAALVSQLNALSYGPNWIYNDDFLMWHLGDAAAPTGWTVSGGGTVARSGTGLADTTTKVGPYALKFTRAGADTNVAQYLMNATSFTNAGAYFKGRKFAFGAWVKTSTASTTRVAIYDGVTLTYNSFVDGAAGTYHPGDGNWHFLAGVHTVNNSATYIQFQNRIDGSNATSYFSGTSAFPGEIVPNGWVMCPKYFGSIVEWEIAGNVAAGARQRDRLMERPTLVMWTQLNILTPPTGQALIVDVNFWDGGAFQSMYSTRPQIAAGSGGGGAAPDGTYRYRSGIRGEGAGANLGLLTLDVDQVGSGTAGANLYINIQGLRYQRPQEGLLDRQDIGV